MDWLAEAAKGLENLNSRMILMAVGVLLLALTVARLSARTKGGFGAWMVENLQVVLSVVVVVFLIIRPFLFQAFYIPSTSMEPTLHGPPDHAVGDRLVANKLVYLVSDPKRLDIAVFHAPPVASVEEKEFIKRVIGLPNETVEVVPPRLLAVDGSARKVALRFTTPGSGDSIELASRSEPIVAENGTEAEVAIGDRGNTLQVIADPEARVRFDAYQVAVNGKVLLQDINGLIEATDDLEAYGSEDGVSGTLYVIDGEPRLAVLRATALEYDPGHVLVDGRRLVEPYVAEPPMYEHAPLKLGPNEYFMMGDNRNYSNDSHMWGPLERDRMIGRAEIIFWPLHRIQVFHWWLLAALGALFVLYNLMLRLLGR